MENKESIKVRINLRKINDRIELKNHELCRTINLVVDSREDDYDNRIFNQYLKDYEIENIEVISDINTTEGLMNLFKHLEKLFPLLRKDKEREKIEFFSRENRRERY